MFTNRLKLNADKTELLFISSGDCCTALKGSCLCGGGGAACCCHYFSNLFFPVFQLCLQCFDAVGWEAGRASGLYKTEWWGAGVVICLERGADATVTHCVLLQ